jgi:hypothetical protein
VPYTCIFFQLLLPLNKKNKFSALGTKNVSKIDITSCQSYKAFFFATIKEENKQERLFHFNAGSNFIKLLAEVIYASFK